MVPIGGLLFFNLILYSSKDKICIIIIIIIAGYEIRYTVGTMRGIMTCRLKNYIQVKKLFLLLAHILLVEIDMWFVFIIAPILGAFIGWITNWLAIKLIFRPYVAIRIPLINYSIQGVIPKRRQEIACSVGNVVATQLLSLEDLVGQINMPENQRKAIEILSGSVKNHLHERLPMFLPLPVKNTIVQIIEDILRREAPLLLARVSKDLSTELSSSLNLSLLVQDKINRLDLEQLEHLVLSIASKELKHIEALGAIIGFFIGLFQALLFFLL